jgi:hypothetical protein
LPTYDLQYNGSDCGNVIISNAVGGNSIQYQDPPGPPSTIPGATCSSVNPSNPQVGDTLNLNNFVAYGHTFGGNALFRNQTGTQTKGYYRTTPTGGERDWDAADTGGGMPSELAVEGE